MIDTQGLPLKFVFHTPDGTKWYFDLTDVDRIGCVGLYLWNKELNMPFSDRHSGWVPSEIRKFISDGNWIIDFEVSDTCFPEVNDLL